MSNSVVPPPRIASIDQSLELAVRARPPSIGQITLQEEGPVLVPGGSVSAPLIPGHLSGEHPEVSRIKRKLNRKLRRNETHIKSLNRRGVRNRSRKFHARNREREHLLDRLEMELRAEKTYAHPVHGTSPRRSNQVPVSTVVNQTNWPIYFRFLDFLPMYDHCAAFASSHEVMGYLIGDVFQDAVGGYALVFTTVTAALEASPVHVRFEPEGILSVVRQIEDLRNNTETCPLDGNPVTSSICTDCGYDLRSIKLIGWYHSHPGLTAFMSSTDRATHRTYFDRPYNVSIVIDPINFHYRVWQTDRGSVAEIELIAV